jgi:K+-transporting ATPase ATPase C chain
MLRDLKAAVVLLVVLTALLGGVYPLVVTGLAHIHGLRNAGGGMVTLAGRPVGMAHVGQAFQGPGWFWSRPSAVAHDPATSAGSNLAVGNPALVRRVVARAAELRALDPGNRAPIPVDLVTASGSGLDPHISLEAARWQAGRVARARGLTKARLDSLVEAVAEGGGGWIPGLARVNVLRLNLALHHIHPDATRR